MQQPLTDSLCLGSGTHWVGGDIEYQRDELVHRTTAVAGRSLDALYQ
jgi:hypothetical protein